MSKQVAKILEMTLEELAKIKATVYAGVSEMLWMGPNRKQVKSMIQLIEEQARAIETKDHALRCADHRLETIAHFSKINGYEFDYTATKTRIRVALEYKGKL